MNPRERVLAILLGCVIILGGLGFFGYQFVLVPWRARNSQLTKLADEYKAKQQRIEEIRAHQAELARWKMLSLPGDPQVAQREYAKYLNDLCSRHGVAPGFMVTAKPLEKPANAGANKDKEPVFTKLTFTLAAQATMPSLVGVLEEFYKTGLLHEIKDLSIQRQLTNTDAARANELTVNMRVEALIITGADKRAYVLPNIDRRLLAADLAATLAHGPTGLGLALWAAGPSGPMGPGLLAGQRSGPAPAGEAVEALFNESPRAYEAIAKKNLFFGKSASASDRQDLGSPVWMAPRFVHLTGITTNDVGKVTGSLYDVSTNNFVKLRATAAYDTFTFVKDSGRKPVLRGIVVKLDDRDLVYRAEIAAEDPPASRGEEHDGFFRLDKKEREKLVEERGIKPEDAAHVYRADRGYWDSLLKSQVIRERDSTSFRIVLERDSDKPGDDSESNNSIEVLRGKILRSDSSEVLVQVESRYYAMHIGQSLEDSLKKPLPAEQVKGLKMAAN
jgi:hypothetical protein